MSEMSEMRLWPVAALLCVPATWAQAAAQEPVPTTTQTAAQAPAVTLGTVVVKGEALGSPAAQAYSSTTFNRTDFEARQITQPEQLFREVPGMEVRSLGYGSVANSMTLRGFSGGGHGGDIGFVIDGIPLNESSSHADGYADLNVIVPLELAGMTVYRGPVSALYGNYNRAGVVALTSRKGGTYQDVDLKLGGYGTVDLQGAVGAQLGGVTLNGAAQVYSTDSYREQSGNQRATLALRGQVSLAPATQLALSTRLHTADADTASVISQGQYDSRDQFYRKNPNVQNDNAGKNYSTLRADLAHTLSPSLKLLGFVYGTQQDFHRYFTRLTNATTWQQRSELYDRDVRGFGFNLNGKHSLLGQPLNWVAGAESYREDTWFRYADALNNGNATANTATAGVQGGVGTLNRQLNIRSESAFGQAEWLFAPWLRPSLGWRHDRVHGGCEVRGLETRTGASAQCTDMPAFSVNTPKLGVKSVWWPGVLEARASMAEGFALPSDTAKFTAGLAVQPTRFRQHEAGLTFTPDAAWDVDVAFFRTRSRDEVALVNAATLTYANLGRTERRGVEAQIRYTPATWLDFSAALARVRTEVLETLPTTPWLVGSQITGVPRHLLTFSATLRPAERWALTAISRTAGRYAISQPSASTAADFYDGYHTLDLMGSYETTLGGHRQRWYLQVANVADERYATSAGITSGTRTYNPGAPRTVTLGASLQF